MARRATRPPGTRLLDIREDAHAGVNGRTNSVSNMEDAHAGFNGRTNSVPHRGDDAREGHRRPRTSATDGGEHAHPGLNLPGGKHPGLNLPGGKQTRNDANPPYEPPPACQPKRKVNQSDYKRNLEDFTEDDGGILGQLASVRQHDGGFLTVRVDTMSYVGVLTQLMRSIWPVPTYREAFWGNS
jgi:hypothetical protein